MRLMTAFAALFLPLASLAASAAEFESKGITVIEPWARATPGGAKVGAAYGEIRAAAGEGDKLIAASSPASGKVEIHTHIEEGGVMKMRRLDALEVKGGETVKLAPGGHHIMLIGLKAPLKEGESIEMTLTFEKAGDIKVTAPIKGIGAKGSDSGSGSGSGSGSHAGSDDGSGSGSGSGPGSGHHEKHDGK